MLPLPLYTGGRFRKIPPLAYRGGPPKPSNESGKTRCYTGRGTVSGVLQTVTENTPPEVQEGYLSIYRKLHITVYNDRNHFIHINDSVEHIGKFSLILICYGENPVFGIAVLHHIFAAISKANLK